MLPCLRDLNRQREVGVGLTLPAELRAVDLGNEETKDPGIRLLAASDERRKRRGLWSKRN